MAEILRISNDGGTSWPLTLTALKSSYERVPEERRAEWTQRVAEQAGCTAEEITAFREEKKQPPDSACGRILKAACKVAIDINPAPGFYDE